MMMMLRALPLGSDAGFRDEGYGFEVRGSGFRVQGSGCRVQGSGFRVRGSGFRVQGSGFGVLGSGCRVQGSGFRVLGSGFRVQGVQGRWSRVDARRREWRTDEERGRPVAVLVLDVRGHAPHVRVNPLQPFRVSLQRFNTGSL